MYVDVKGQLGPGLPHGGNEDSIFQHWADIISLRIGWRCPLHAPRFDCSKHTETDDDDGLEQPQLQGKFDTVEEWQRTAYDGFRRHLHRAGSG